MKMENSTATWERHLKLAGDLEELQFIGQEEQTSQQFHEIIEAIWLCQRDFIENYASLI